MKIGQRLRELRAAKGLSQGHIEKRTGLFRCYVSRVECGHTVPSLETLDRWAKALDLELYQLFYLGKAEPQAPEPATNVLPTDQESELLKAFNRLDRHDKTLLLSLARTMTRHRSNRK